MSTFKEYNNNTFYIGPGGTTPGKESDWHDFLRIGYATYPFDNNSKGDLIWFGLKQGDNFEGVLKQNIDYSNGLKFTSSHSDCQAMIKSWNPAFSPDPNTGMQPLFLIGKSDVYREITFKWKDFVVFKFIQYGQPNKLLICKPTQSLSDYINNVNYIALSTRNDGIPSNISQVWQPILNGISYTLFAIEKLNHPSTVIWHTEKLEKISSHLKYIKGQNFLSNQKYYLLNVKVVDNNTIIQDDFDKIKSLGTLFVYLRTSNGEQHYSGQLNMKEDGNYMLAEID